MFYPVRNVKVSEINMPHFKKLLKKITVVYRKKQQERQMSQLHFSNSLGSLDGSSLLQGYCE